MKFPTNLFLIALLLLPSMAFPQGKIFWSVDIDQSYMWNDLLGSEYYYMANEDIEIEIQAHNYTGQVIEGMSVSWKIYGIGDITTFNYYGGGQPIPGIVRMGGFEEGGFWDLNNTLTSWSWDGMGVDTLGHIAQAQTGSGWIQEFVTTTKYKLLVNIPDDDYQNHGSICIDSLDSPYPEYDWLFSPQVTSRFGGPYCIEISAIYGPASIFQNLPVQMVNAHNIPFDDTFYVRYSLPTYEATTAEASVGDLEIISPGPGIAVFEWTFDPPCDWAADGQMHEVTFTIGDNQGGIAVATMELFVTNSAPVFSGPYGDTFYAPLGLESQVFFEASDINGTEEHIWTVTFDPEPAGTYSINQGVVSFMAASEDVGNTYEVSVMLNDCEKYSFQAGFYYKAVGEALCGDLNYDGAVNVLDILALIDYKLNGIGNPGFFPWEIADCNGDGIVNILDIIYLINYKFKGGPAPNCPDPF